MGRKARERLYVFLLLKLPTWSYLTNGVGHEIGTEKVLNFDGPWKTELTAWFTCVQTVTHPSSNHMIVT